MSSTGTAVVRTPRSSIALNIFLASTLSMLGGISWLVLLLTGGLRPPRSGHLRVIIAANDGRDGPVRLNFRVPLTLLRLGARLPRFMPTPTQRRLNHALHDQGLVIDIAQLEPEDLDEIIDALGDTSLDISQPREDLQVRIFGE